MSYALNAHHHRDGAADTNYVALHMLQDPITDERVTPAFGKGRPKGGMSIAVSDGTLVRRLTPVEAERLQDLPDGWTLPGPDSRRYSAIGDAVTASVAEWIGGRLRAALSR